MVTGLYLASVVWSLTTQGTLHPHRVWTAVAAIFIAERVVTVRRRGPVQMALAATLVVEMSFDVFLQCVQAKAIWDALTGSERRW